MTRSKPVRLFEKIIYDPLRDPRVCDLSANDVQCEFVTEAGDGFLHCAFNKGHSGIHHTAYVDTDTYTESFQWFLPQTDLDALSLSRVMRPGGLGVIIFRILGPFSNEFKVAVSVSDCPKFPPKSTHHIECVWHAANEGYTVAILPARIER
jgi:hypothetical protein